MPNKYLANQYHNPDNPKTHELQTGPELWEQTEGRLTDVVIGMGTGGSISGIGRHLDQDRCIGLRGGEDLTSHSEECAMGDEKSPNTEHSVIER